MAYGFEIVQPPVGEPISLAEAKAHCRIDADITQDDDIIATLITAARQHVEQVLGRCLVSRSLVVTWDRFPRYSQLGGLQYQSEGLWDQRIPVTEMSGRCWPDRACLRIPHPPLQQVLSVQYTDLTNTLQVLDPSQYRVDLTTEWARISPAYGVIWPLILQQLQAVNVQYVAGYGPVTSVVLNIAAGAQTVTPASMYGIYAQSLSADPLSPGTVLSVDSGKLRELVTVTAVTLTTFTATFAQAHTGPVTVQGAVPETIRAALKLLVGHWYRNREGVAEGQLGAVPMGVAALLGAEWDGEYT